MSKEFDLIQSARVARDYAYPWKSGTRVGCAIRTDKNYMRLGWNIEGLWMTSIHAEVCAIKDIAAHNEKGYAIAIVSDTEFFTPCGACIDWLMQFCLPNADVAIVNKREEINRFKLNELMPHYPRQ